MSALCSASYTVKRVKEQIAEIRRLKAKGGKMNMAMLLRNLQTADVEALSASRGQVTITPSLFLDSEAPMPIQCSSCSSHTHPRPGATS